ncbi:MAG TPA: nucleoside kinase [Lachnoclostridium phytofermentans]|uniref:Nucleoside kinase n=1 Tax=Lachnoclostridium phytofermentans TaxID=66219 RepID=A0A3D2XB61_9FIRM|nr:nucleoside kinase [Lachnoclostridium sp.]HCL04390.1 nucleoside kinase [Lachnoclostridium phytofermentans]
MFKVTIDGVTKEYKQGTTYLEISKEYQSQFKHEIILVLMNGRLRELFKTLKQDCTIEFVTISDDAGRKTYARGLIFVMIRAIYRVLGHENIDKVRVEHSIGSGLYCELDGKVKVDATLMDKVKKEMQSIIQRDIPFMKRSIATAEAAELFHKYQMYDKEKLFRYRRVSSANLYNLDGFEDYYYGYMPASTGILKYFDIFPYEDGFILMLPTKEEPETVPEFKPRKNLFETLQQANQWGRTMEISTVGSLNDEITKGNMNDIILIQEALQEKRIAEIAEKIKSAGNKKFIMIAGPSSSGKTTFSHRLSIQLRTLGYKPHPIAIDDYFVNREDTPKDEFGNFNFESIYAIDIEQFNKDMTALLNGETVELPNFNFKSGLREYKGNYKKLGPEDILVIEGIHGLNDELSYSLPKESRFKIYISALTQLNIDEHNRIPTTDGRLIRRMVRDARTRGTSARETIAMWPSVRRGEEENIFPFQEEADCMFNSALIYELSVLKQYAEPALFGIDKDCKEYIEAKRLLKFLDYFLGVSSEDIPKNSIIREFIGGSCFKV